MTKLLASLVCALVCAASLNAQTAARNTLEIIAPSLLLRDAQIQESAAPDGDIDIRFNSHTAGEINPDKRRFEFALLTPERQDPRVADAAGVADEALAAQEIGAAGKSAQGFRWESAMRQSLLFLAVQHGYAMTQPKTRRDLKGKFFHDYFASVRSLRGWEDGGKIFTNYIAHPMQGSFVGFIQIQNDPKGMRQRFGKSGDYWRSRMKAMAWSAAWSTQFEIGPISQASIGNVGLHGKQTYVDLVLTPTLGTAMLVTEDALDRFLIERIERGTNNFYLTIGSRMLLNPTRTVANLIRFKKPWHRDRPRAN